MKILLINPDNPKEAGRDLYAADLVTSLIRLSPFKKGYFGLPLALTTLAALTPKKHKVRVVDESIEKINFNEKVDLVGITAMTFKAKRAYEIAAEFRSRGIPVVMGGIHASMCPKEVAEHVDTVCIGEADELWPKIVEDAENGQLKDVYRMESFPAVTTLPPPRHEASRFRRYANSYLQTARGCPFACSFCTVTQISGRRMRFKTPEQVVAELDALVKLKPFNTMRMKDKRDGKWKKFVGAVFLVDDNFAINRKHAVNVSRAIQKYQEDNKIVVNWFTQVNFRVGLDEELLQILSDANCQQLFMGFESLDPITLKAMNKRMNSPELYEEAIANVRKYGMEVVYSTILGGDNDTPESAERIGDFVEKNNLIFVLLNILTPYPGTALHREMFREKRINSDDWDLYNIRNVVHDPKRMTADELKKSYLKLSQRIFDFDSLIKRGKASQKTKPAFQKINLFERTITVVVFLATILGLVLGRRLNVGVAFKVFKQFPGYFMKHGTIDAAWGLFGIALDYDAFARSEQERLADPAVPTDGDGGVQKASNLQEQFLPSLDFAS